MHRAEIMRLRGSWAEAEREARRALIELEKFNLEHAAEGFYELGEVRLRIGDLAEAEDAFRQAHELGRPPYPGLPLLRLAQGKAESAASSMKRGLEDPHFDRLGRCRLLPAEVEIALAIEDVDRARQAVEELETTVADFNSAPLRASALCARGALQLAEGDPSAAASTLRRAWRMWKEADLPYEAARARVSLGIALRADGDEDAAVMEIQAARSAFERLGAILDLRMAMESLGEQAQKDLPKAPVPGVRVEKTFMFTDIVSSTNLVEVIGDEAWESLLTWHDQTLRKLFKSHCGEEVKQIGDGFFVAFDDAADAVECAVQMQRRLSGHRKEHGFAPQVRIGLHRAEATRKGQDYGGKGVHTAARVGALARGGEILATTQVIESGSRHRFPVSESRSVILKGVSEPAEVVSVQL